MSGVDGSKAVWQKALIDAANFFYQRKAYLANLFLHTSGLESFITYMREIHCQIIRQAVEKASPGKPVDAMTEMYIRVYVLGAVQFTCEWILGKFEADPEKLAMVYEQTLPPPLQRRLSE